MADDKKILFVIPARRGSKRVHRKNIKNLAGKPLICWTIEAALPLSEKNLIVVSSDDEEVLDISNRYKNKNLLAHKRPKELASDTSTTDSVVVDAALVAQQYGFEPDTIVLLQPTSPLRKKENIVEALQLFEKAGSVDSVVSVSEVDHPSVWIGAIDKNSIISGLDLSGGRSQDHEKEYRLNGAIYVISATFLMQKCKVFTPVLRAYVMPREFSIDIDENMDFKIAESLFGM
ncbi:N-acylneuraminate cytidylyltransferase/CMP-N,N'-diacetyllegionaminic acid synthase [Marinobacter persicus]|uniref:N-acylneuraminate cytidylyltransferase/CMP-N,N'-diacetyllegionaminic acid synthase n=1 Tax=Marinobacter persicus TaxID=930118 RepID=A0A1I3P9X2_9GAMM|nr:acylneuraminate cytidylyltransferase family protein [Marinobacter persicus]GHD46970.1 hypothetical protein GCM10008110_14280 [Marinobacter persicus]SFJ18313.1 N-acylneuraminate cytidylyltransferase/CMP-N,N'-diacetyllegionaminic acid synthase [Marinobacter persicus]